MKPRWLRWTAIDAAADTAASREDAMPCPRWARSRLSRKSVARDCQGCSSRRTISSPILAELRQCTRRSSSPRRYSRTVTSSAEPVAKARGRLSPGPGPGAAQRDLGERHGAGGDGQRDRGVEGAAELDEAERVADPHAHRPDLELAADVGADLVGRVAAPALADAVEHEPRPGAEHVRDVVLEQQRAAGRLALVGERQVEPRRLPGRPRSGARGCAPAPAGSGCARARTPSRAAAPARARRPGSARPDRGTPRRRWP